MAGNENANHPDEKKSLKSDFDDTIDDQCNSSTAKFMNGKNGGEACVELPEDSNSEVSFSGLGKEELMRFADDPFWVRVRIILFALFWIGWILMLVAAVVIIVLAPRCPERPNLKWYETNVVYKVDPKSFKDTSSNDATATIGKGVGDLKGIEEKIGYIQSLGANTLWITSFYESGKPLDGNDVVDHTKVSEVLGTMDEFKAVRKDTKKKGMKMIVDFIPNHTGKKHEWFMKSQKKEENFMDYYIWVSGPNDTAPNNWKTVYGGSAWEYDNTRQQWYYFSYLPEYPDLNLNNPDVLNKLDDILRFWLNEGVDGFNLVGLQRLMELNDTTKGEIEVGEHTSDLPGNFELVKRWRNIIDKYSDKPGREKALFGYMEAQEKNAGNYSEAGVHVISTDALIKLNLDPACDSECLEKAVAGLTEKKYRMGWMVGNEKTTRFGTRVSDAGLQKVYQVLHFLMPGTPIVYYGDEIAMVNGVVLKSQEVDPAVKYGQPSCDPFRTPMLWNNDENAGFCAKNVTPWLPVNADYSRDNVQFNSAHLNGFTILESFKALAKLREKESFQWGAININVDGDIMYFTRKAEGFPGFLVAVNRGGAASYSFASVADMMTLVYNSENTNVEEQFSMKDKQLAFKEGQIYVFQY